MTFSYRLTMKGLAASRSDTILFNAPCQQCKVLVQRRLSGAYDVRGEHVCRLVRAA